MRRALCAMRFFPMLILALETATLTGSAALVEAGFREGGPRPDMKILAEATLRLPGTHSERLMPSVHNLLEAASRTIHDVEGIALSLGPGSFTGLRIGASTAKGLAFALKIPVAGISTLEALANNAPYHPATVCPVLDARKKEVYAAFFQGNEEGTVSRRSEDRVLSPEDLCRRVTGKTLFLGDGAEAYAGFIREKLGPLASFASPELSLPRALNVAKLSLPLFQNGRTLELFSFAPVYLRRSEAEIRFQPEGKNAP